VCACRKYANIAVDVRRIDKACCSLPKEHFECLFFHKKTSIVSLLIITKLGFKLACPLIRVKRPVSIPLKLLAFRILEFDEGNCFTIAGNIFENV
jgi:hypothetical protein